MNKQSRSLLLAALALLAVCSTQAQTIIGAWSTDLTAAPGSGALVFLSNGYYIHVEDASPGDEGAGGADGYEIGKYSWNSSGGAFAITQVIDDTNGDIGPSTLASMSNLTLTFSDANSGSLDIPDESATNPISRITNPGSAIVGAWIEPTSAFSMTPGNTYLTAAVFFSDLTFYLVHTGPGTTGIERGTYTWTAAGGAFTSSVINDTNGNSGLSESPSPFNAQISGVTLTFQDGVGPSYLTAASAIPEPSTYAALAGLGALGLAVWRRRLVAPKPDRG